MNASDQINGLINAVAGQFGMTDTVEQVGLHSYMAELSNKIITYELASCRLASTISGIILVISVVIGLLCFMVSVRNCDAWISFWICVVIAVIAAGVLIYNLHKITVCQTFPDKIVLEYFKDTLRSMLNNN